MTMTTVTRELWTYGSMWTSAPGRLGTFQGHLIASTPLLGVSFAFACLALKRSREGIRFWGPERNPQVLLRFGWVVTISTILGIIYEFIGVFLYPNAGLKMVAVPHTAMYSSFTLMGIMALLEAKQKLRPDSCKRWMAVAILLQSVLWYDHAYHKGLPEDIKMHLCLALATFASSIPAFYQVYNPDSMEAHLATIIGMFWVGSWTLTTGFYVCCIDISLHIIPAYLFLQLIVITTIVTLVGAFFGKPTHYDSAKQFTTYEDEDDREIQHSFSPLRSSPSDDEDDDVRRHSLDLQVF